MKSPESYKKEYPESAKGKFAIPRDAEGKPNKEVFELARSFVDKLSKYPSFIGVAPYGSKMKGYSSAEDSDTDIAIFTEFPNPTKTDELAEVNELRKDALETAYAYGGPEHVHIQYYDFNEGTIKHSIVNHNFYPGRMALATFFGVTTGPKVEQYKKLIAEEVNNLSEERKKDFIDDLVDMAVGMEDSRTETVQERIPSTKEHDLGGARAELWEKRITNALKI